MTTRTKQIQRMIAKKGVNIAQRILLFRNYCVATVGIEKLVQVPIHPRHKIIYFVILIWYKNKNLSIKFDKNAGKFKTSRYVIIKGRNTVKIRLIRLIQRVMQFFMSLEGSEKNSD
jgi:hypothetical protein